MSSPEISIQWGGGRWPNHQKRVVRPTVRSAAELAVDGLDHLGIHSFEPKVATVWRCSQTYPKAGSAKSVNEIELYFKTTQIKRRKVGRNLPDIATTILHELIHAVREERYELTGLKELAATEGLAYAAETMVARALLFPGEFHDNIENAHRIIGSIMPLVTERFVDDANLFLADFDRQIHDFWFEDFSSGKTLPLGALFGVVSVGRCLSDGHAFADLMHMPAEELLGL